MFQTQDGGNVHEAVTTFGRSCGRNGPRLRRSGRVAFGGGTRNAARQPWSGVEVPSAFELRPLANVYNQRSGKNQFG